MKEKNRWGFKEQIAGVSSSKMSVIEVKFLHTLRGLCVIYLLCQIFIQYLCLLVFWGGGA